jgi:hypothetical protein
VEIPEEGKARLRSVAKSAKVTTPSSLKTHQMKRTRKRFRSGSSCGQGLAALDYPMFLSSKIL